LFPRVWGMHFLVNFINQINKYLKYLTSVFLFCILVAYKGKSNG
jgi:hypothetical protein